MPTINIRVSKEVKQYLKELAAKEGKTLSAMLRESATSEAYKVLRRYGPQTMRAGQFRGRNPEGGKR